MRYAGGDTQEALTLFREAAEKDQSDKALGDDFFAGLLSAQTARRRLGNLVPREGRNADAGAPGPAHVEVRRGRRASRPGHRERRGRGSVRDAAAALTLAEVYQRNGRIDEAIGLLQQLVVEVGEHPFLILSLCDLYAEVGGVGRDRGRGPGITNEDDVSLQVRLIQARAFEEQGMNEAALEAYKDALRSKKRDPELLKEARYERGRLYIARARRPRAARSSRRSTPRTRGSATSPSCSVATRATMSKSVPPDARGLVRLPAAR